jgi:mannosyltransferase
MCRQTHVNKELVDIQVGKCKLFMSKERTTFLVVFLLAFIVRVLGISSRPIWYDEAFAILFSEKGLEAMVAGTLTVDVSGAAADIHPLAYYAILGEWMKVFGENLFSVRMLSILLGLGIVILSYLLLRSMFADARLASVGALGIAFAPFLVHYSQEIRMYALLALTLTGATYALWQGLHSQKTGWWVLFTACAALAQYTQNLAAFYLVPLALTPVFMRRWDKVKRTFLAGIGAVVLYLPWLIELPAQFAKIQDGYWVKRPTILRIFMTLVAYLTNIPVEERWLLLVLVVTFLVITIATVQTFFAFRRKRAGAQKGLWLAYLAFSPLLLMFFFSQWQPVYLERALLASGVIFWLWLAWALTETGLARFLQILNLVLLTIMVIIGLVTHLTSTRFPYGQFQSLNLSLRTRFQPGDVVIHSDKMSMLPALYFDRTLQQNFIADPSGSRSDTLARATQQVLGVKASPSLETAINDANRIWFIIFQESIDIAKQAGLETHPHIKWLDEHFHHVSTETWGSLLLFEYIH